MRESAAASRPRGRYLRRMMRRHHVQQSDFFGSDIPPEPIGEDWDEVEIGTAVDREGCGG
jgi:hypothetical protein